MEHDGISRVGFATDIRLRRSADLEIDSFMRQADGRFQEKSADIPGVDIDTMLPIVSSVLSVGSFAIRMQQSYKLCSFLKTYSVWIDHFL